MFHNGFEPKNEGKMHDRWPKHTYFRKSDVEGHDEAVEIWGELEQDDFKKIGGLDQCMGEGEGKPTLSRLLH